MLDREHLTESSIPQGDSKTTPLLQQWLDWLSKAWVPLLAAIYGSGYLIVSIYHASLGLNAINLLRPQVAAAGILFLVMTAVAVDPMRRARSAVDRFGAALCPRHRSMVAICFGGFYLFGLDCMVSIVIFMLPILHFEGRQRRFILIVTACFAAERFGSVEFAKRPQWVTHWVTHRLTHRLALPCLGIATLVLLATSLPYDRHFGLRQFAFFLFLMQTSPIIVIEGLGVLDSWLKIVTRVLFPLLVYSLGIYPHVRQPFGGGNPTSGQIFLTTAIGNDPAKQFTATIIDETDAGFYVIQSNQKNVRYVPRSLVSSIEFNKPTGYF
jgi:hypothetical protein